jgi:putative transposase
MIRSATLSKTKSGNFFLSILVELPNEDVVKYHQTNEHVGIDLGVKDFVITSDGEVFENKHFYKSQEQKIAKLQRQMSKKQKGSNNRNKVRIKLAKAFEKLSNQKEHYIHSVVNDLLTYYDIIFMEDLNVSGMLKNHKLAKAIQEVGFFRFKSILVDKAFNNGKQIVFVDRFYPSSKTCSVCGYKKHDLKLSDRVWTCPQCGEHHDRDINAAINIRNEGMKIAITETATAKIIFFVLRLILSKSLVDFCESLAKFGYIVIIVFIGLNLCDYGFCGFDSRAEVGISVCPSTYNTHYFFSLSIL